MAKPNLCSIPNCRNHVIARGWCDTHYRRWRRHGSPTGGKTYRGEVHQFFHETVLTHESDDCLPWPYASKDHGYGVVWHNQRMWLVHRLVCTLFNGPEPSPAHEAAHLCGNGHAGCCNWRHLAWKTPMENTADKFAHDTVVRGEKNYNSKLTEADIHIIRASSEKDPALGRRFGVARETIRDIKARKSWAWVS